MRAYHFVGEMLRDGWSVPPEGDAAEVARDAAAAAMDAAMDAARAAAWSAARAAAGEAARAAQLEKFAQMVKEAFEL